MLSWVNIIKHVPVSPPLRFWHFQQLRQQFVRLTPALFYCFICFYCTVGFGTALCQALLSWHTVSAPSLQEAGNSFFFFFVFCQPPQIP